MVINRGNGPLAPIIKGIAAGVGLASEYSHHRKDRKATAETSITEVDPKKTHQVKEIPEHLVVCVDDSQPINHDQIQWELDEAQEEVSEAGQPKKPKTEHDPTKIVKQFTDTHPIDQDSGSTPGSLLLPVVLPQRRPKKRARGFVRAYAPDLEQCGIDQDTFMNFVEVFNNATLAAPWLDAINLASLALAPLPTGISTAISIAISVAVDITKTVQSRYRHNYILEQLNNDFFRPRGLYALVLTWQPDNSAIKVGVNLDEMIADNMADRQGLLDKANHNFRPSMGNTVGVAFQRTAPLVFPVLDSLVNCDTPEAKGFKQSFKSAQGLIAEYMDRRAQAEHIGAHPDSQLGVNKPVFTSRYSDPNHASNNGDLLSLVSGGRISMPQRQSILSQRMRGYGGYGYPRRRGLLGAIVQRQRPDPTEHNRACNNDDQEYYSTNGQTLQPPAQSPPPMVRPQMYSRSQNSLIQSGINRVFGHVSHSCSNAQAIISLLIHL